MPRKGKCGMCRSAPRGLAKVRGKAFLAETIHGRPERARGWRGPQALWAAGAIVAISGLVLVAVGQTGSPASLMARLRPAAPAAVTITIGNITIGSQSAVPRGSGSVVTRSASSALIDRRPDLGIDVSVAGGRL